MILEVKYWPHPCLKKVAEDIDASDPYTETFIEELFETMYAMRGVGLAATQCNVNKRILVIDATQADPVNMEITTHGYTTGDRVYIYNIAGLMQCMSCYAKDI